MKVTLDPISLRQNINRGLAVKKQPVLQNYNQNNELQSYSHNYYVDNKQNISFKGAIERKELNTNIEAKIAGYAIAKHKIRKEFLDPIEWKKHTPKYTSK